MQSDSLNTILDRINATQQEATVSFNEPPQRVTVESTTPGTDIVLDDGGTGLFSALNIRGEAFIAKGGNNFSARRAARRLPRWWIYLHRGSTLWVRFDRSPEGRFCADVLN